MIPSGSCPGISGSGTFSTPWNDSTSLPQIPHASMRNNASSAPITGSGNSRASIRPGAVCTIASPVRLIASTL